MTAHWYIVSKQIEESISVQRIKTAVQFEKNAKQNNVNEDQI